MQKIMNNNKQCTHSALNGMTIQKTSGHKDASQLHYARIFYLLLHYLRTQFHKHFHQVEIVSYHMHTLGFTI